MNNEQNNNSSLTELFGTETNESANKENNTLEQSNEVPKTTIESPPQPEALPQQTTSAPQLESVPQQPASSPEPEQTIQPQPEEIKQPQIPVYDPNPPKKKEETQNNNQNNLQNNNSTIVLVMLVLIIGVIAFFFISGANKKDLNSQISNQNTVSDDKKETMLKMINGYTKKMEPYLNKKDFICDDNALIKPTTYYIEIDTTEGNSMAQKNAKILNISKSPWNSDIKGHIRVEEQINDEYEYSVRISDNNHGIANLTKLSELTERSIKEDIPYPNTPDGIKCLLGGEE